MENDGFANCTFHNTLSDKGDACHIDIKGMDEKKCKNVVKKMFTPPRVLICCKDRIHQVEEKEFEVLLDLVADCK